MKGSFIRRAFAAALAFGLLSSAASAKTLIPGGQSIGVALSTGGLVVIGASDVGRTPSPARLAGIKSGDVIEAVDGIRPESAAHLTDLLHSGQCRLTYTRSGKEYESLITPVYDEGEYRLGVWVRDSAAGIGTLTYYDPETGGYGALGHAVTDSDAGIVLPVDGGTIYENTIVGVEKGRDGRPGEILGQFYDGVELGSVDSNNTFGIFGTAGQVTGNGAYPEGIETASRDEVHTGRASILTTVDERGLMEFNCEIVKVERRDTDSNRSFTIQITDDDLISVTGGIVQGMSGSPIIQDGKIVGAVTHVLVDDPTSGYGVFIDNMLGAAG